MTRVTTARAGFIYVPRGKIVEYRVRSYEAQMNGLCLILTFRILRITRLMHDV